MREPFQLDLLVGRRVYDSEGRKLGRVDEILLVRENKHYTVDGLLIGVNGLAERLGVAGPLERLERRLNLHTWRTKDHIIKWNQIDSIEERSIRLKVPQEAIEEIRLDD